MEGRSTRPTSDRARETIFNVIMHRFSGKLENARVLDLFAGTGALGFEALSRGAAFCLFVETAAEARAMIWRNVETLGLQGCTKMFRRDATRPGAIGTMTPFGVLFADPPYGKGLAEAALAATLAGGWLRDDALCIVEEAEAAPFEIPPGFSLLATLGTGGSVVRFMEVKPIGETVRTEK